MITGQSCASWSDLPWKCCRLLFVCVAEDIATSVFKIVHRFTFFGLFHIFKTLSIHQLDRPDKNVCFAAQMQHWAPVIALLRLSPELCVLSCLLAVSLTNLCNFFERCVWSLSCFHFYFYCCHTWCHEGWKITDDYRSLTDTNFDSLRSQTLPQNNCHCQSFMKDFKVSVWHYTRNSPAEVNMRGGK